MRGSQSGWGRDYYVRAAGNDYCVDPQAIDRLVNVVVSLDEVCVFLQGRTIARHQRARESGVTLTDPAHVESAAKLRSAFQHPPVRHCEDDLARDLAVYDRAFGLTISDFEAKAA